MKNRTFLCVILAEFIFILYLCNHDVERTDYEQRQPSFSRLEEFNCIEESKTPEKILCFEAPSTNESFPELDASTERELFGTRRNIFLLETSCFREDGQAKLEYRQACTIEAAARMNPNMNVNLFFLSPAPPSDLAKKLLKILFEYKNFRIFRIKAPFFLSRTPLEHWYWSGIMNRSNWPNIHLSDILRLLTLWKYGGIYLDLDMIPVTCLEDLTNFLALYWGRTNAAAIGLSATGLGFEMANEILSELIKTYNGSHWDDASCGVPYRALQKLCNTTNNNEMNATRCKGFQVLPREVIYPFSWDNGDRRLFLTTPNGTPELMKKIKAARMIHVFNTRSRGEKVLKGSLYDQYAQKYCPAVYKSLPSIDEF